MKTSNGTGAYHHGFFGRPTILMGPADKGGSGGGGDNDDDDDDGDDGINEEAFGKLFNKFFHKAFGEREKRFEQKVMKSLETTLSTKLDDIVSKISEAKPKNEGEPKGESKGEGGAKIPPEIQAQLAQMQKDLAATKELAEKHKREAEEQKAKSRRAEELNQLTTMLTGAVKPALLDMVVNQLHANITRDEESGAILWKGPDGELLPLKDGIEAWKKSDAGKEVAPPRQASGSGGQGGSGSVPTRPGDFTLEHLGNILTGSAR